MAYTYDDFDEITSWWELRDFCHEYGLTTSYDYVDLDEIVDDFWVKERVSELASDCQWDDIYQLVSNLNNSTWEEGIYHDAGSGLEDLSWDYFDPTKEEVLAAFREDGNHFEDEEPEDEDEEVDDEPSQYRPSKYTRGVSSVYGRIAVQDCYDTPDVVGCNAEDFGKFFGF